ncbi:arrestin domain-containing protein 17-like [Folsomia candida]|uniref:arrestin domain-containing protein 17-like n=1 Tax=Folsomia candida TaxID=158441 RepID=UPI0016050E8B|nr:arrestin domain-containing protein 17-like [Folsomia candida]
MPEKGDSQGLKFPFTFQLPRDLPSSFRRTTGRVVYTIDASATDPSNPKKDITANLILIVNGMLNLSHEMASNLNKPVQIEDSKKLGLFSGSGNIGFTFKLDKSLFAPGEFIGFSANLENHSKQKIEPEITLVQVMEFHVKQKMKTQTREVVNVTGPEVLPGREEVWVGKDVLKIPDFVLPTGLGGPCKVIKLQYTLKIKVGTLCRDVPITIGESEVKLDPPPPYEAVMKE